jgi:AbrB family looped-hinge helix DNA binding protein
MNALLDTSAISLYTKVEQFNYSTLFNMPIVTVKNKFQVVIPAKVRDEIGIEIGDILEAKVEKGKVTLTPKSVVDRQIAQSLEDYKKGRSYGPFDSASDMISSLKSNIRKRKKKSR